MSNNYVKSEFKPSWLLANKHTQTLYPTFFRKLVEIKLVSERLITPDNDFIDINYPEESDSDRPLVMVFHGLEGSIDSPYSRGMLKALYDAGMFPVFMHFRGCSGETNRTTKRYHSAETSDPAFLLGTLVLRYPGRDIYAVGFSLGGNMLLNWLNDLSGKSPIKKAVAISVPFDLANCDQQLQKGLSRIYLSHLLKKLHNDIRQKYQANLFPFDYQKAINSKTFWEFDEYATAPLHGFTGADDYYKKCSSLYNMKNVKTPTLIIQSKDDPFLSEEALPDHSHLSPAISLELSEKGGHVGFIAGSFLNPVFWAETRAVAFFTSA